MVTTISQVAILIFSGASVWALAGGRTRLGFILGLGGQPFWIFTTWQAGQWGMLLVSLWFTYNYLRGLRNYRCRAEGR